MRWKRDLLRRAIITRIPFSEKMRRIKRKLVGYSADYDNLVLTTNNYCTIKDKINRMGKSVRDAVVLEIGTGWLPTIPIILARDGARKVLMTDLNVHLDDITFLESLNFLRKHFPEDQVYKDVTDMDSLPLTYLAPFDISNVEDETIDIIVSHTCLEHIPKSDIFSLMSSLRPKLKTDGCMVHSVDHSDHFEHHDKSLSRLNFLTWSEETHALVNYAIKGGENRLRHHEYIDIFTDAGYILDDEECTLDESTLANSVSLDLKYPFSNMKPEQLCIVNSVYSLLPDHGVSN